MPHSQGNSSGVTTRSDPRKFVKQVRQGGVENEKVRETVV